MTGKLPKLMIDNYHAGGKGDAVPETADRRASWVQPVNGTPARGPLKCRKNMCSPHCIGTPSLQRKESEALLTFEERCREKLLSDFGPSPSETAARAPLKFDNLCRRSEASLPRMARASGEASQMNAEVFR